MKQRAIPFWFMRGGTSRAPFFKAEDLPTNREVLSDILIAVMGSGHVLNIDGIGGGAAVTTKVAILSKSDDEWADVEYLFAQVSVEDKLVDYKPTCGNILAAVAPAALEMGLLAGQGDETQVKIRSVNTGARVVASLQTPGGEVVYQGDTVIDGVPGTAAKIALNFMDVVGSVTGKFLPTGNLRDVIKGIEVTCMDVAMPMVIARAGDFGLTGYESRAVLDANKSFFARMETVRVAAGLAMAMGDVRKSVTPKFALLAQAKAGGTIAARYFMPWSAHPTMAVTGSQCIAACALALGTIADGMLERTSETPRTVVIEHPSGVINVLVDYEIGNAGFTFKSAALVRTARKLAAGEVFVPATIWPLKKW